jgi:hypothetical protein
VTHLFHSARFTIKFYPTTLRNRLYFIDTSWPIAVSLETS